MDPPLSVLVTAYSPFLCKYCDTATRTNVYLEKLQPVPGKNIKVVASRTEEVYNGISTLAQRRAATDWGWSRYGDPNN